MSTDMKPLNRWDRHLEETWLKRPLPTIKPVPSKYRRRLRLEPSTPCPNCNSIITNTALILIIMFAHRVMNILVWLPARVWTGLTKSMTSWVSSNGQAIHYTLSIANLTQHGWAKRKSQTGETEALIVMKDKLSGYPWYCAFDFAFMGAPWVLVVGDRFEVSLPRRRSKEQIPLVCFAVSGGACMQEDLLSSCRWRVLPQRDWETQTRQYSFILWCWPILCMAVWRRPFCDVRRYPFWRSPKPWLVLPATMIKPSGEVLGEPFSSALSFGKSMGWSIRSSISLQMKETIHRLLKNDLFSSGSLIHYFTVLSMQQSSLPATTSPSPLPPSVSKLTLTGVAKTICKASMCPRLIWGLSRWYRISNIGYKTNRCLCIYHVGAMAKVQPPPTIAEICQQTGYKTALYQSPHLLVFNRRVRINGKNGRWPNFDWCVLPQSSRRGLIVGWHCHFWNDDACRVFDFCPNHCDVWYWGGVSGRPDVVNVIEPNPRWLPMWVSTIVRWLGDARKNRGRKSRCFGVIT